MASSAETLRQLVCRTEQIGVSDDRDGLTWPSSEVLLASVTRSSSTHYLLALPTAILEGEALTAFLAQVAPFGCPVPMSLIRAYSLPDSPFPSMLLKEHEAAPAGLGEAYGRFVARARTQWMTALQQTGSGLCPILAWEAGPARRFLTPDEWSGILAETSVTLPGVADDYLGRGLLLLAHPDLTGSWQTVMSLGGITSLRKITGREFPVWIDLPAHQPALLASPVLTAAEQLLAKT